MKYRILGRKFFWTGRCRRVYNKSRMALSNLSIEEIIFHPNLALRANKLGSLMVVTGAFVPFMKLLTRTTLLSGMVADRTLCIHDNWLIKSALEKEFGIFDGQLPGDFALSFDICSSAVKRCLAMSFIVCIYLSHYLCIC